ncbi:MAG: P1 family peptidase [Acidobacteriota bacterium]|nr:MAG: P1 family peptidase [Acidobacteriota bacterium]
MTPHRQWCYTKEKGTHWYDGPEEQFAPLYRFVKSHANLFDDFETFADATLVFSQTAYRNGDALKQAGRDLTAAGFSYNLAVAGDETLSHPLDPQQLRQSNRILVLDPATLQPKDRDRLQERCADPQVTCYPSASDLVSSVRPAVDTGTSTDYILLPRKSGDQVVVHLVDRDPRQANRESDLFVDAGAFGWKQIGTATLFQPGQPEITLPVQSNAVRVPSIPIWGILTLSESREGVVGNLQSGPSERARDLGVPFEGVPGPLNAITDVEGVEVGHSTIISGAGALETGKGPIRTGVTTVLPRGKSSTSLVFAGWFSLNGNGEMTGTSWVEESGLLEGPVMITNTHSVGVVRDAVIRWRVQQGGPDSEGYWWSLPVVAETWDGYLNDINGFHVHPEHVFEAIENANSGPVEEGNVGGGTGMVCHEFKGGIGTSSRVVSSGSDRYTVGVLVQANYGLRDQLRIAGVPVGLELREARVYSEEQGSIIIVIATDAPLLSHQLKRLARRATLGLARVGSTSGNGSGDIFIAFSTANPSVAENREKTAVEMLSNDSLSPIFDAVVQATEESIVNALVAAETMVGRDDHRVIELPHDQLRTVLKKYGRLNETTR